jgi:murein DD-endopeptidase MepM/ murein hydrolase activator NlpD
MELRINGITLVALALIALMGFNLFSDRSTTSAAASSGGEPVDEPTPVPVVEVEAAPVVEEEAPDLSWAVEIHYPYDDFILTQGVHGESYGHMAIDLTGGKGAEIHSPISGEVTAHYVDEYGNTTLQIDNEIWQVLMLHGNYKVSEGQWVEIGETVGYESNNGYTVDFQGRSCWGRDCGYHTHLNVYDKRLGSNVNPLEVLEP